MTKTKWRDITNDCNDSVVTVIAHMLYRKDLLTEKQFRKVMERKTYANMTEGNAFEETMDMIENIIK